MKPGKIMISRERNQIFLIVGIVRGFRDDHCNLALSVWLELIHLFW